MIRHRGIFSRSSVMSSNLLLSFFWNPPLAASSLCHSVERIPIYQWNRYTLSLELNQRETTSLNWPGSFHSRKASARKMESVLCLRLHSNLILLLHRLWQCERLRKIIMISGWPSDKNRRERRFQTRRIVINCILSCCIYFRPITSIDKSEELLNSSLGSFARWLFYG